MKVELSGIKSTYADKSQKISCFYLLMNKFIIYDSICICHMLYNFNNTRLFIADWIYSCLCDKSEHSRIVSYYHEYIPTNSHTFSYIIKYT